MDKIQYIAVEGPIGVGKSSLVRMLAKDFAAYPIFENPDHNPFLPSFYQNKSKHAFQTQLFFLLSRYQQQMELKHNQHQAEKVVCDYIFAKDHIFAGLNLTADELDLYQTIFKLLDQRLPKPDVVILLQAQVDVLLKRIKLRNKDYEKPLQADYLTQLSQAYSQYFFHYSDTPLLVVNTSGLDFVNNPQDYETLKHELILLLESGQQKRFVTINQN